MNSFLRLPLLATALLGLAASGTRAQTAAYVETASLSILWNFTITGVSGSTIGPKPIVPGAPGSIDPDDLRPTDRITTDIGTPMVYSAANGDQAFFTKHLLRNTVERYAEEYKALAEQLITEVTPIRSDIQDINDRITAIENKLAATVDADERDALIATRTDLKAEIKDLQADVAAINAVYAPQLDSLQNRIFFLTRDESTRWELTSVREPQTSLSSATSAPFKIFLTRIDPTNGRSPTRTFDTGVRIVPIYSAGQSTETLSSDVLTKATGSYTTHFSLEVEALFADDPLSEQKPEDRAGLISGLDYNTKGSFWTIGGTGYMTYRLRSTPAPVVAVSPTAAKITGHGSWAHIIFSPEGSLGFSGVAPLSIKMGEIKYQDRNLFPDMNLD